MLISQDTSLINELQSQSKIKIIKQQTLRTAVCLLNIDKPGPLTDIRVRRALQHAVNRNEIITKALHGCGKPLFTAAPAGSLAFARGEPMYDENSATAKDLLNQAGYSQGITLKVMAANNKPTIAVVSIVKKQLAAIGITLDVHFFTRDEIKKEIVDPKLMGASTPSGFDLWILNGWPDIFGASAHFYFLFLHSRGIFNFGINLYKDSQFDDLYAQALSASDDHDLAKRLQKLDRIIMEQSLVVPLCQIELIYAMDKKIQFNPGLNDLPPRFKECSIK